MSWLNYDLFGLDFTKTKISSLEKTTDLCALNECYFFPFHVHKLNSWPSVVC